MSLLSNWRERKASRGYVRGKSVWWLLLLLFLVIFILRILGRSERLFPW